MDPKSLPSELTIRQLATVLGLTVPAIRYRIKQGVIPSRRIGPGAHARVVVPLDVVQREYEWLWKAIVHRLHVVDMDLDDLDDE